MVVRHFLNEQHYLGAGKEALKLHELLGSKTSQSQQPRRSHGQVNVQSVKYNPAARTATLTFKPLDADVYQLKIADKVQNGDGLGLMSVYQEQFTAVDNLANALDVKFGSPRSDRQSQTISYDVTIKNKTDVDLNIPLLLSLNPQLGVTGKPLNSTAADGAYLIDLSSVLAGGKLKAGQSITSRTITISNPDQLRPDFLTGAYSLPQPGIAPTISSSPFKTATVGKAYQYQVVATAGNSSNTNLGYLLTDAPKGMTIDPQSGLISWLPTVASPVDTEVDFRVYDSHGAYTNSSFKIAVTGGNHLPVFDNIPASISGAEGQQLLLKVNANDADNSRLTYWADNLPDGSTFNPVTHTLSWTPDYSGAGVYDGVEFFVSDGYETVKQTAKFIIEPTNQAPTLSGLTDRTIREGDHLKFQLQATDAEGGKLTYSTNTLPSGATLDPNTGVFEWTPDYSQAGEYTVPFAVSDGENQAIAIGKIQVLNVNAAPVFDDLGNWQVQQGQVLRFQAFATDPDYLNAPSKITYTATNLPSGAIFDADTANFSWTPTAANLGTYNVTFTATDDGNGTGEPKTSIVIVPINVFKTNHLPVFTPISNFTLHRGETTDIPVVAKDADGNPLILTAAGLTGYNLPDFITFVDNGNGTGVLRVKPDLNTDAGNYIINLTATENRSFGLGEDHSSTTSLVVQIDAVNDRPKFNDRGDTVAVVGQEINIPITVRDRNQDALTYSISGLPAGAQIAPSSVYGKATLTWTPAIGDVGNYPVTITVTDSGNGHAEAILTSTQTFNLSVRATNTAPILGIVGDKSVAEESAITFQLTGTDLEGDKLTYMAENLPSGAILNPKTGVFNWSPIAGQAGDYRIKFITSDGNKSNSETIKLTVRHTNHKPILTPLPLQHERENQFLKFTLAGSDIDQDSLLYTITGVSKGGVNLSIPQGVTLDQNTGKFAWKPNYAQAGEYTFKFAVLDAFGGQDTKEVEVLIDNIDRAPTLNVSNHAILLGNELKFNLDGQDFDANTQLVYTADNLPPGAILNAQTGEFKWNPNPGQLGNYPVKFTVSDGELTAFKAVVIKAATSIAAPKLTIDLTPSFPVVLGQKVVVNALANSIADIASISAKLDGVAVDNLQYNTAHNGGNFTVIPTQLGRHELEITATDVDGRVSHLDRVIKVKDTRDTLAPVVSIAPELNGAKLTQATQIIGKIIDTNLDEWKLEITELGTDNYRILTSSTQNSTLNYQLSTTNYQNGFYQLRLTGTDISGRSSITNSTIEINTPTKSGYHTSEQDLSITLGGVSIDLTRSYDSTNHSNSFGNGWQFLNTDSNIQLNLAQAGANQPVEVGTRLILTTPTGERVGFTFTPVKQQISGAVYYTPNWVADAGVNYTLRSVDAKLILAGNKFYDLQTAIPYNPASGSFKGAQYTLTASNGTIYQLDAQQGLVGQIATNGTQLIYSDSGIVSSTGEVVEFVKDAAGRITQITAPDGTQLVYDYNSAGDLISMRNSSSGKVENYSYTEQHQLKVLTSNIGNPGVVIDNAGTATPITQNLGGLSEWNNGKSVDLTGLTGNKFYTFNLRDTELKATNNGTLLIGIEGNLNSQVNGIDPIYTNGNYRIFTVDRSGVNLLSTAGGTELSLSVIGDVNHDGKVDGVDTSLVTNAFGAHAGDARYNLTFDIDRNGSIDPTDLQLLGGNYGFTAATGVANNRPGKLGSVQKTPTGITLAEGNSLLTQTTQHIKLGTKGQHLIEFDLDANFDLSDKTSATVDRLAIYIVDPITHQTILDRGERGTAIFSLAGTKAESASGVVQYQGKHVQIDLGSLTNVPDAELVFQLINGDKDTGSRVSIQNLTDTVHSNIPAATLTPKTPQLATLGGGLDLTNYTPTTGAQLLVSDVWVDSSTGKYVADLKVRNTGTSNLPRNLAVLFPDLPVGVALVNKSGTSGTGVPYLNFQNAVEVGGLLPNQESELVRVTFDDPTLAQFSLTPVFLSGSQDLAPTFKSLGIITLKPGEQFTTDLIANDPNNTPIGISLQNLIDGNAAGLSTQIDSRNRLTITPSPTQIGTHTFTLVAHQGNLVTTRDVTVNVIPDPITTTRVSGVIQGTDGKVLAGVVLAVGTTTATTNAMGEFTLTLPVGDNSKVLKVVEQITPTGVSHSGFSTALTTLLGHNLYAGANNQLAAAIQVPLIDFNRAVSIDSTHQFTVTNSQIPQAKLEIQSGSLVDGIGQPTTALVSLSEVPLSAIPAALPDSFYPDTLIAVTFSGEAKLTTAAAITAPNRAKYTPDTKLNLWKLDANTGELTQVGKGVVSLDGSTIKTTTGGVLSEGIYTYLPEPVAVVADKDNPFSKPLTQLVTPASVPINSQANLIDGSVTDIQQLVGYQSMGVNHAFTLHYNSQWADPTRFLNGQTAPFNPGGNYNRLVEKWVVRNGNNSQLISGSTRDENLGLHGGEHFYKLPEGDVANKVLTTPFTEVDWFGTQASGIYQVSHTLSLAKYEDNYLYGTGSTVGEELLNINRSSSQYGNADFGAGWSLGGVQELLLTRNDGKSTLLYRDKGNLAIDPQGLIDHTASVAIVDGDGSTILYRPAITIDNKLTYTSPVGDFSKFVKNLTDGTYTRTLKDGTIYQFDQWGQLDKIQDLNGNITKFTYDPKGHLIKITDPADLVTSFEYFGGERIREMKSPGDRVTKFDYDDNGDLKQIINPDDGTRKWEYNPNHHIKTFTDRVGNQGTDLYDRFGRANGAIQRDGNQVDFNIAFGKLEVFKPTDNTKVIAVGQPLKTAVPFIIDEFNAEIKNANHETQKLTLNQAGQITKATDALNQTKISAYTLDGLTSKTTDIYGNVTTYKYDDRGNVTDIIYGDADADRTTRIFSDKIVTVPLDPNNKYGGVGNATQVAAYTYDGKSIAVVGTSKSQLEFVFGNAQPGETPIVVKPLNTLVESRYDSLQQLAVSTDSQGTWLYVGYDTHSIDDPLNSFYLKDNRYSSVDSEAQGRVAKFKLGAASPVSPDSDVPLGASVNVGERAGFSVGDLVVGAVRDGKQDVVAINAVSNFTRLGVGLELDNHKLLHITPFDLKGRAAADDGTSQPTTVLIPGVDYYQLGYQLAVLDNQVVAATIPGKSKIALFKLAANYTWTELNTLNTPGDISALKTIKVGNKQQLVYLAGKHVYLQDPTNSNSSRIDLGLVGSSQALAVGDLNNDGIDDIAVADYQQNLHVLLLNPDGTIKSGQTSKINTKPRDITIFDWNHDGYNDILIADGGSGLDIKLNQLTPVTATTPPVPLLDTKFKYEYATGTDRIVQKTEIDIVQRGSSPAFDLTRQTISTFDNITGNLTKIKVIGSDHSTTAETSTIYNPNGTISTIEDAQHHITQYTYFDNGSKQIKSIERGVGTLEATSESYEYDGAGNVTKVTDGRGNITNYEYDKMNRQTKVIKTLVDTITSIATDNITTTEYYKTGLVKSVTDANNQSVIPANNHATSFTYDGVGRILTQTAADGGVTTYEYDNQIHNLKSITDPVGRKTNYTYYANQQLKDVITDVLVDGSVGALSTTTHYEYAPPTTAPTNPTITTTMTGGGQTRVTVDKYDRYQRLIESTNPIGKTIKNEYFDDGTIKSSTVTGIDSLGALTSHQTQFKYDPFGRQNEVVDALGNSTSMVYDLVGNLTSMTDANGHLTSNTYDSLNRKTQTITPVTTYDISTSANTATTTNLITKYQYDKNSNLTTITDTQGRVTTNTYDELNRRTTSTISNPLDLLDLPITTSRLKYDGVGNIIAVADANNHTTTYGYDLVNRQNKVTDALGKVTSQKIYDKVGRVISGTNLYGETTTSTYNDVTHVMTMTNSLGTSTQKTDAFGNVVETKDAVGRINNYEYDKLNRRTKATDYRGGVVIDSYDDFNNLISEKDASNNTTTYQYDQLNRRTNTADSLGQISRIEYDNVGNKVKEYLTIDTGVKRETDYKYDELNRQYSMTTAVGTPAAATIWMSYDKVGNVIGTKDALGRISTSIYDKLNRQTAVTQAWGTIDATTSSYKYDNVGNRIAETNGRDYTTEYKYDELNRQIAMLDPYQISDPINNPATKTEYFDKPTSVNNVLTELAGFVAPAVIPLVGKVIKTTDALNHATYTLYDKFDRQIETYDPTKHRTSASQYDAVDRVIGSTDTFGQTTSYSYQDAAKKQLTVDAFGKTTTEIFDVAGNLTDVIDSLNRPTHYDYDKRNRQTKITNAEGGTTDYAYYNDGKTKSIQDAAPAHNLTTYFYDVAGRLIEEDSALGNRYYKYDLVNNRIEGKDRNGRTTKYDYDHLNRVKSEEWVGNGQTFTYNYDKNSNRLTANDGSIEYDYSYDQTDLLTQVDRVSNGKPTVSFKYDYDNIGNLTQTDELIANAVTATTIYKYNSRNLNTEIIQTGAGIASKDVKFTYDAAGSNTKVERYLDGLLKLTTTNAFDAHGRLTGIEQKNSGGVIGSDSYELDELDRLTAQTKDGLARSIAYDNTDQVKTVTGSNSEGYTYDKNGNRTNTGYVTGSGNRLMSDGVYNYQYDLEGNRKSRTKIVGGEVDNYTWDYRNRLTGIVTKNAGGAVIKTVGYEYDVDDQRVSKTVNGVVEKYYLDGNQIAFVTDGSGNETFHYLYGLNVDQVLAQDSPAGMVWALADRLGSIDTLTDANGVVVDKRTFDSFGRILSETNPSVSFRYEYTGRERDLESGLDYYRARYYDPQVGRFISVDPMGFGAGDTNLYRYVGNSSTNATDPSGEWINFAVGAGIGFTLDLGFQLWENKGDLSKTDLTRLAISTASGAIGGGIASGLVKGGALLTGTALAETGLGLGAQQ